MINQNFVYELKEKASVHDLRFYFVTDGKANIIKTVRYKKIGSYNGNLVFNLGFGNYDPDTTHITDDVETNNGDQYHVFNIVLSTIPRFFELFSGSYLMVTGSDGDPGFMEACRPYCIRSCAPDQCRKFRRRIKIYRNYINKNWDALNDDYQFSGGIFTPNGIKVEAYDMVREFDSVFVIKKIITSYYET